MIVIMIMITSKKGNKKKEEEKKGTLTRLIVLHSEMNHALNVVAHVGNHGVIPSFKSFFVWRVVDILPLFTL